MTSGIHHITAIASSAADCVHFYTKILGLRLVKKTVNQDDTTAYHLFFGDKSGQPGMDLTFFIFKPAMQGSVGTGMVSAISLAVPAGSLVFWQQRFEQFGVQHQAIEERFEHQRLRFSDTDGQKLELVEVADFDDESHVWTTEEVSKEHAIRHFYSATLSVVSLATIEPVLTHVLGYIATDFEDEHRHVYNLVDQKRAAFLEVSEQPSATTGLNAAGTVHHIAFRAKDEKQQLAMRQRVLELGLYPTEVINRYYFKSVYFRVPAGILFEIATDGPGFTVNESVDTLGERLDLPPFLEDQRSEIAAGLEPL